MSRDSDKQYRCASTPDVGRVQLGDDGTATVSTHFARVVTANANHNEGALVASTLQCSFTGGTVTITDSAGAINAGAWVTYYVTGY
jgi:hypothetical protein